MKIHITLACYASQLSRTAMILEKYYSKRNVDMFLRNYECNKQNGVDWSPIDRFRDYQEDLLRQQAAVLSEKDVYFFGCGMAYHA